MHQYVNKSYGQSAKNVVSYSRYVNSALEYITDVMPISASTVINGGFNPARLVLFTLYSTLWAVSYLQFCRLV